jgi:glycosyltransferase involved in cell wall biosynthesis
VIVVLDGWWPNPALPTHPRLRILHWGEAKGLRPSLNAAVQMATGEFLFKLDAHCALMQGYDEALAKACDDGEVVVPAKHSLEPESWQRFKAPWHYYYLLWPWPADGGFVGLQDRNYGSDYNVPRESIRIDDILSYQGSAWMLRRSHWDRILPSGMDHAHYYYAQEPQEVGFKTWLSGGRVRIVKDVWYAHLWKGKGVNKRQFSREKTLWNQAMAWSCRHWLLNEEPGMTKPFSWLVEKFGPLPGWPSDWDAEARRRLA